MASFCLVPQLADQFIAKLKTGELDPAKLSEMSSEQRRSAFKEFLGDADAHEVNLLFESKLLLKNQQQGMINWAKQVAGMKPEALRDIVSRVNKLDKVLNPKDQQAFLEDLVAHKLEASVTMEEAAKISELAKDVSAKKTSIDRASEDGSQSRLDYGRAQVAFQDYVGDLKADAKKLSLRERVSPKNLGKNVSDVAGLAKSMKATLDNSVIGRQGLKTMFTNPKIWLKNSIQSFSDMARVFGGKAVMEEVRAEVLSRENNLNGLYKKEGLAIGVTEEAFPTSLPEKIWGLGRIFKASETAFTAWQYRTRADIFDKYVDIAQKTGVENFEGIGKVANSLTGRGTFGQRGEAAATVANNVFFSPRLVKSHIDLLTAHAFDSGISPFARKQAAYNMVKVVAGIATVLEIANAVAPGSVEKDPRSADFGKIKVKDTRFDVTGGMSSLATLAFRIAPLFVGKTAHTKSSVTGKLNELNARDKKGNMKFGAQTGWDLLFGEEGFTANKLSPLASFVKDMINQNTREGEKPTLSNEASNLFVPLPITNFEELKKNPNSANIILAMLADALGISTNTYSKK